MLLPVSAYTSQEWFQRELTHIFSKTWCLAGLREDLSEYGQFLTVQAGLNNIIVVQDQDGQLRAYHNICRHRGTRLLRTAGKVKKVITCPYHDWSYGIGGELLSVPEQHSEFPDLDKKCLALKPASVDVWRGMIFVHPDPKAQSLSDWFAPINDHLGPHRVLELVEAPDSATKTQIRANWKIVVENFIDVYHLSHLHSGTLSMYDHKSAKFGFYGPHFAFAEPLSRDYLANIQKNSPLPLIVPESELGAYAPMLFPGLGLSETESSWSLFHIRPIAADLTEVVTRTKVKAASTWEFAKQSWRSYSFWANKVRAKYEDSESDHPLGSGNFMEEDVFVCEQQQQSLASPFFEVGPMAKKLESPIIEHQRIVLDYLDQGDLSMAV